jgi:menaquinone-dependent protoporphyrinogen oxidase
MSTSIIVAHTTKQDSMRDAAEVIGAALRKAGLEVSVEPIGAIDSLKGYAGVVVGGPLHLVRWDKDGRAFLDRHRPALAERLVAIFALGSFPDREKEHEEAQARLESELTDYPWLTPVAVQVFGQKFDPVHLSEHFWPISAKGRKPASQKWHWTEIGNWGTELAVRFLSAQPFRED